MVGFFTQEKRFSGKLIAAGVALSTSLAAVPAIAAEGTFITFGTFGVTGVYA